MPFRAAEARRHGVDSRRLRKWLEDGLIIRLGRGLYEPSDSTSADDPDLTEITIRAPQATICLTSALAHYELIDDIPSAYDLALPRGTHRPRLDAQVNWRWFDVETFGLERISEQIRGVTIPIYSPARSVVDTFRMRGYEGYETAHLALRHWLSRKGNRPAELLRIAQQLPRSEAPLRHAMEVLL